MGIGAQLLDFTETHAREHGLHEIRLYTNGAMTENIVYYARRGYSGSSSALSEIATREQLAPPDFPVELVRRGPSRNEDSRAG